MIAWAGIQRFKKKLYKQENESVKSRWPLDENAPFLKDLGSNFNAILVIKTNPDVWSIEQQKKSGAKGCVLGWC